MSLSSPFRVFSPKLPLSPAIPKTNIYKSPPPFPVKFPSPPLSLRSKKALLISSISSSSPSPSPSPSSTDDSILQDIPPNLQSIIKNFQSVENPRAKYEQLLFYGRNLVPLDPQFKTPQNKVPGCVSQVWVRALLDPDRLVRFEADSDSLLTKGLAALLVLGLSGLPASSIARLPPHFLNLLGLQHSLTPSRTNGFLNMFLLMQRKAIQLDLGLHPPNSTPPPHPHPVDSSSPGTHSPSNPLPQPMRSGGRAERIRRRLEEELCPVELDVEDISHQHAGHAGVAGRAGETHFNLAIVSKEFEGKSLVKRHRMVYDLLQGELNNGLHALSIVAKTPSEAGR